MSTDNDEDADISSTIAEADYDADDSGSDLDCYWNNVEQFDDEALNSLLLTFNDISLGPPYDEQAPPYNEQAPPYVEQAVPIIPSSTPVNQVAGPSRLPFVPLPDSTKWYVVTRGSETGVYDDWCVNFMFHFCLNSCSICPGST